MECSSTLPVALKVESTQDAMHFVKTEWNSEPEQTTSIAVKVESTQAATEIKNMEHGSETASSCVLPPIDVKVESTQASHEVLVLFLVQISY